MSPVIRVGEGRLVEMVSGAKAALFAAYPDEILQHNGRLVRPVRMTEDDVVLLAVTGPWLRLQMARCATWLGDGGEAVDPPPKVATTILNDLGDWPFHGAEK